MTMASGLYLPAFRDAMDTTNAVVDLQDATNKVLLVTDTYTPNFDTGALRSTGVTNELSTAGGYTQNSKTVGGTPTYALGALGHDLKYTWSTTVSWTSASFTARGMVLTTAVSDGLLIMAATFGADYTATNGTFTITAHTNGIYYITLA